MWVLWGFQKCNIVQKFEAFAIYMISDVGHSFDSWLMEHQLENVKCQVELNPRCSKPINDDVY